MSRHSKADMPLWKHIVAGGVAGVAEVCVMYPLDVVKTRNQLASGRTRGVWATLVGIVKEEGPGRLYRGLVSPIMAEAPKRAAKFAFNETYKDAIRRVKLAAGLADMSVYHSGAESEETDSDAVSIDDPNAHTFVTLSTFDLALAGALAGGSEAFVNCPFEVVKVRMQAKESVGRYANTYEAAVACVKADGVRRGLFRGLTAQFARNAVWNGTYFASIGAIRKHLPQAETAGGEQMRSFAAGCAGGALGVTANTPLDMVKSRLQNAWKPGLSQAEAAAVGVAQSGGIVATLGVVYRREGFQALYKGWVARLLRLGPGGGIMLVAFDVVSQWLQ